jgi:hypothetical protein
MKSTEQNEATAPRKAYAMKPFDYFDLFIEESEIENRDVKESAFLPLRYNPHRRRTEYWFDECPYRKVKVYSARKKNTILELVNNCRRNEGLTLEPNQSDNFGLNFKRIKTGTQIDLKLDDSGPVCLSGYVLKSGRVYFPKSTINLRRSELPTFYNEILPVRVSAVLVNERYHRMRNKPHPIRHGNIEGASITIVRGNQPFFSVK